LKLNITPLIKAEQPVLREFKTHAQQVNALSEGRLVASYNAQPTVPTTGVYAVGDVVRNSAPAELGSTPNKYVVYGWMCLDDSPLTFVQMRFLTGN
jgi:hypothetical protein